MINHRPTEPLTLFPLRQTLAHYSLTDFRADAMAGFTVALLAVPQAMAYALVAGLPLSAGLLSAFIGVIFGASFGSSRHLVMGPTNAIAILIQAATADILYTHFRGLEGLERELMAGEIVIQITLLIGILQLLASGLGLGRLVQFVSRSVVVGYVNGAALAIFVGQLFVACGIQKQEGAQAVWAQLCAFVLQLKALHLPTLVVTCASLFLLAALRRTHWRVPPTVLMLGIVSGVLLLLGGSSWGVRMVGDYGTLDQVLPSIHFPVLRMRYLNEVLPHAFAIALLGILEATSAAKAVSLRSGRRFQINQEIFGLGVCNLFSAGIGAMPASGSASRSFLNFHSGARTRCAAVFSGLWVGVIWALLGGVVVYIPLAALSAILFLTAATMVDWSQLRLCLRATGADAAVLLVTTTAAVFMSLDVAFYTGVMLSLALYLREASIPRFLEHPMPVLNKLLRLETREIAPGTRVVEMAGELFFGSAELLEAGLAGIINDAKTRTLILRLRHLYRIDATACITLERLHVRLAREGKKLILCDVTVPVMAVLRDSGVAERFGADELYLQDSIYPTRSLEQALAAVSQRKDGGYAVVGQKIGAALRL